MEIIGELELADALFQQVKQDQQKALFATDY